jgi:dUTP pyrophosphatase
MINLQPTIEMKILDERLYGWGLPKYHSEWSAGIDMYACLDEDMILEPQSSPLLVPSGIAVLMGGENVAALLLARSGLGHKRGLVLSQAVGTIDADYTAEIFMSAWLRTPPGTEPIIIHPGDRIAQLVFLPILRPRFSIVDEFTVQTERGAGGFGSTGR